MFVVEYHNGAQLVLPLISVSLTPTGGFRGETYELHFVSGSIKLAQSPTIATLCRVSRQLKQMIVTYT